jgi:hypothetical protein
MPTRDDLLEQPVPGEALNPLQQDGSQAIRRDRAATKTALTGTGSPAD